MFGDKLQQLRKDQKMRQEDLGEFCGVAKQTISNWENNVTQPPFEVVVDIAKYFNVSVDYLLGADSNNMDKEEKVKRVLKEAGWLKNNLNDLTEEEFEQALQIIAILKKKRNVYDNNNETIGKNNELKDTEK